MSTRRLSDKTRAFLPDEGRARSRVQAGDHVAETVTEMPDRILQIGYAFWQSKALLCAVELDVFTALSERHLDLADLTSRIGIHARGARDFFDALVAIGLLDRDAHGRYGNQPDTARFLDRSKPTYIGGLLKHLNARHYQNWGLLTPALRSGAPQSGALASGYPALYADEFAQEKFLAGMTAGSLLPARALAARFPWDRYKTFIDIGTAEGCLPVEIALAHPHLSGGGFDLPAVAPAFARYVEQRRLSDRLQFYPGDFFRDPLPAAEVLVMGRILHNWDLSTKKLLLKKAYQALSPAGALIVYDPLIDDERRSPHGLLSSLNMLIETAHGFEYTGSECKAWMLQAGFDDVRVEPLGDFYTAVIGTKGAGSA
jgi:hypothetical protein